MEEHILRESIPKIREYIPKNYSQHRIHVFSLPMRHMLCPFQVLEAKFTKRGVLDLVSHLHDAWPDLQQGLFGEDHRPHAIMSQVRHLPLEKVDHVQALNALSLHQIRCADDK
jgi:hypothetical protein